MASSIKQYLVTNQYENVRNMAKNGDLKTRIYGSKNKKNSEYSRVFCSALLSIYLEILMKMYEKIEYHRMN